MPGKQFMELDGDKRGRIVCAALAEFAEYGYAGSSTNRMVKACGISKGSLFMYFENKEELYFYVLDTVAGELARDMESGAAELSKDLFERIAQYSAMEISWYIKNPVKGRFMIKAFSKSGGDMTAKALERYGSEGDDIYRRLMEGTDSGSLRHDAGKAADIIKWVLAGFNECFLEEAYSGGLPFERLREDYLKKLSEYMDILRDCL